MTFLHRDAQALIEAANRGEAPMPAESFERVQRSILRRATWLGGALTALSMVGAAGKRALAHGALVGQSVAFGVGGACAGAVLVVAVQTRSPEPRRLPESTAANAAALPLAGAAVANRPSERDGGVPSVALGVPPSDPSANPPMLVGREAPPPVGAAFPTPAAPRAAISTRSDLPRGTRATTVDQAERSISGAEVVAPSTAAPADAKLALELELLHRVHAALGDARQREALELLDSYERRGGARALEEQALAARITALCQLLRSAEASRAIERFLAEWPNSLLAERMRGGCFALVGERDHVHQPGR